ncbi:MAG: serine/threonine protein kinase [Sumerlaeia bacterium]
MFNNHIILDKIGGGAQGDVYLAKQLSLNRYVALKKLTTKAGAHSAKFFEIFRSEAQTIAKINHPNIVQVYDIFAENNEAFFTMESINGKTIKEMIQSSGGQVRLDIIANIACQACSALSRTSEDHLVHRDIKPANMMLDANGNLKIVDFGLAAASASLKNLGGFAGTPIYGAPEQFDGENLTPAVDQYSLGVTLYEALTGVNPFKANGLTAVEKLHKTHIVEPPSVLNTELPKEVDSVLLKMLAKKPEDRFASFDDCYKGWEKILSRASKLGGAGAAVLLGESLIRLGKEESKALTTRGVMLGGAWVFLAAGAIMGNIQLQNRDLHAWLDFAGNAGTAILVFSLFCIFYVAMARQKFLPTIGSLRGWLITHIVTAIPAIILLLIHSGNFLANITPGPPQAKPLLSILMTLTLIVTAVSGSVGLLIFRALRKQIQLNELNLRKGQQLNPRQAMMTALSAQLLSGWRLIHYPLAVLFVVLSALHIVVSLQYRVLE